MAFRSVFCPGPVSRRGFLQIGSLLLGGLGLSDLLRLRAAAADAGKTPPDTSVILVWLEGGPSQLETFDLKPQAPAEYRGEFQPIQTVVPGLDVCELLPLHAKIADKFNLIRSISHDIADHPGAAGRFLTGQRPVNISDTVSKFPTVESLVARARESRSAGVPTYISNVRALKGGGSAYLGQACEPFVIDGDPNLPDFQVENISLDPAIAGRLDERLNLLQRFDHFRRGLDLSDSMHAGDKFNRKALDLLSSQAAGAAFDIHREPAKLRERYGRDEWGQRLLLARRLVEAGCSFVTVQLQTLKAPTRPQIYTWDDHGDGGGSIFDSMRARLPYYDRSVSALIEDVYQRGLDKQVMIVVAGEFGRTPKVMFRPGSRHVGRDHWPGSMSVLVAGGGMRTGQVIGSTNARGEMPVDRPLDPNDFLASIYRFLGIDVEMAYPDRSGRPMPILPYGTPMPELAS
jgi:Protein of unknown function (DUF1501)